MSNSLWPLGLQYARLPCPSPSPRVCSKSCPLSQWYPWTISSLSSFSSYPQTFPASGSFPMSQLFPLDGQSIRASSSASVFPMNIQSWFPLELTGLISLLPKGLSRVFSNTTVWRHQFFGAQPSSWSCSWESQLLGRLIRSPGFPRRREESGILKERQLFFFSLYSLVLVT